MATAVPGRHTVVVRGKPYLGTWWKLKFGGLDFGPTFGTCTKTRIGLALLRRAESHGKDLHGKLHFCRSLKMPQDGPQDMEDAKSGRN